MRVKVIPICVFQGKIVDKDEICLCYIWPLPETSYQDCDIYVEERNKIGGRGERYEDVSDTW